MHFSDLSKRFITGDYIPAQCHIIIILVYCILVCILLNIYDNPVMCDNMECRSDCSV